MKIKLLALLFLLIVPYTMSCRYELNSSLDGLWRITYQNGEEISDQGIALSGDFNGEIVSYNLITYDQYYENGTKLRRIQEVRDSSNQELLANGIFYCENDFFNIDLIEDVLYIYLSENNSDSFKITIDGEMLTISDVDETKVIKKYVREDISILQSNFVDAHHCRDIDNNEVDDENSGSAQFKLYNKSTSDIYNCRLGNVNLGDIKSGEATSLYTPEQSQYFLMFHPAPATGSITIYPGMHLDSENNYVIKLFDDEKTFFQYAYQIFITNDKGEELELYLDSRDARKFNGTYIVEDWYRDQPDEWVKVVAIIGVEFLFIEEYRDINNVSGSVFDADVVKTISYNIGYAGNSDGWQRAVILGGSVKKYARTNDGLMYLKSNHPTEFNNASIGNRVVVKDDNSTGTNKFVWAESKKCLMKFNNDHNLEFISVSNAENWPSHIFQSVTFIQEK